MERSHLFSFYWAMLEICMETENELEGEEKDFPPKFYFLQPPKQLFDPSWMFN